jgi:hypothetical protein
VTDRQGNSATMQGIRILQSWNCALEDCKVAKIIDIAMLRCWEKAGKRRYQGGEKPPRPLGRYAVQRTACPRQGAKALLIKRSVSKVLLRYFRESNKGCAYRHKIADKNREDRKV